MLRLHPRFPLLPVSRETHRLMLGHAHSVEQRYQPANPATAGVDSTHEGFHDHKVVKNMVGLAVRRIGWDKLVPHTFNDGQRHREAAIP